MDGDECNLREELLQLQQENHLLKSAFVKQSKAAEHKIRLLKDEIAMLKNQPPITCDLSLEKDFFQAVTNSQVELMSSLVTANPDLLNVKYNDLKHDKIGGREAYWFSGETALIYAVRWDKMQVVEFLVVQPGLNAGVTVKRVGTAFILAAMINRLDAVELMLRQPLAGVDIHEKSLDSGYTALMFAARSGNLQMVELLLSQPGITVNEKNDSGSTAFMCACAGGKQHVVERLLEPGLGVDINEKSKLGGTALMEAAKSGNVTLVELLVRNGADLNKQNNEGRTALMFAVRQDHVEVVQFLLKQPGINVRAMSKTRYGTSAFMEAVVMRQIEIIELFADVVNVNQERDKEGSTALHWAARSGCLPIVEFLMKQPGFEAACQSRNQKGQTVLMAASMRGNWAVVEMLAKRLLPSINDKDDDGFTALMVAAEYGQLAFVKFLLQQPGINVAERNKKGYTALLEAARSDKLDVVELLSNF